MSWEPVESWEAEQPQRCTICGDVLSGRDLSYIPIMCEREGCPDTPPERLRVVVAPVAERTTA